MLSKRCGFRNEVIIPRLLKEHVATTSSNHSPIDLATAENWTMRRKVLEHITAHDSVDAKLSETDLEYSTEIGGSLTARSSIANLFNNYISPRSVVSPQEVILAAGATYVLDALVEALCDPGDSIMIATPYWSGLDLSISIHNNAVVLPVPVPIGLFFELESISYYENILEQATAPVKAVLLCNPHNPLGNCYPSELVGSMLDFCQRHQIHMVSDEVYALSIFGYLDKGDSSFASALSVPHNPDFVHVVYSLSKDFGCNGIRMGALISQNRQVRMSVALSTHTQLSSVTAAITNRILTPKIIDSVLNDGRIALRKSYDLVVSFLDHRNIDFIPARAGMFIFAKICSEDEADFQRRLQGAGVLLASGTSYHFRESGWFRICFGMEPWRLTEGLARLAKALEAEKIGTSSPIVNEPGVRSQVRKKEVAK